MASISTLVLLTIFLAMASQALATRAGPAKVEDQVKRPDCFDEEGTVTIPGIGRLPIPGSGIGSLSGEIPSYGDAGFGFRRQYIPGADDLPVPNPGYEVPIGSSNP